MIYSYLFWSSIILFTVLILVLLKHKSLFKNIIKKQNNEIANLRKELNLNQNSLKDEYYFADNQDIDLFEYKKILNFELKKALIKAENANYLKNAFLANMSHEIRTPLNGIIGFSNLLKTELSLKENNELFEYANNIKISGDRLLVLLNNIIDISRIEAHDYQLNIIEFSVKNELNEVCNDYKLKAQEKGLTFNFQINDNIIIKNDKNAFIRLINNVLDNSLKYTQKGFINLNCMLSDKENEFIIRIKDTGVGIDKAYLPFIFEAFRQESLGYSRAFQGAGLGLPFVNKLISLMGGRIEIESEKSIGTVVSIYFEYNRISDVDVLQVKDIQDNTFFVNKKYKIFVVEDDRINRMLLKKMLENMGETVFAVDGDETLKIVEEYTNKGVYFDIMLFDINLPEPWDGVSLMSEVKRQWQVYQTIPFVAQTAYALELDKDKLLEEGFDDYIAKPVDQKDLIEVILRRVKIK